MWHVEVGHRPNIKTFIGHRKRFGLNLEEYSELPKDIKQENDMTRYLFPKVYLTVDYRLDWTCAGIQARKKKEKKTVEVGMESRGVKVTARRIESVDISG
jgi:hypothetical protein